MSVLVENDLLWLANPKCAAKSIYQGLIDSDLQITHSIEFTKIAEKNRWNGTFNMIHLRLDYLKSEFGNKKSFCVTRDYFDRFLSALSYIYDDIMFYNLTPIIPYNEIDNDFLYNFITDDLIYELENSMFMEVERRFITANPKITECLLPIPCLFSNGYMKSGFKVEYEFDISEINKLEMFLSERYNKIVSFPKMNESIKKESNIVKNDKLREFIWNKFEKKYHKKSLI